MANCAECGEKFPMIGMRYGTDGEFCKECFQKLNGIGSDGQKMPLAPEVEAIVLTTETVINSPVQKRIKIIMSSVECVFDVKIPKAESELLYDLKRCAYDLGANAVVGVNIQFIETYNVGIGIGEFKKFKMIAYGTAMIIEP